MQHILWSMSLLFLCCCCCCPTNNNQPLITVGNVFLITGLPTFTFSFAIASSPSEWIFVNCFKFPSCATNEISNYESSPHLLQSSVDDGQGEKLLHFTHFYLFFILPVCGFFLWLIYGHVYSQSELWRVLDLS